MREAGKRSKLYFNQWGCLKNFPGGAFPTAFSTSICFSERKQPPWNQQSWAINLTRRNFPWEIHHLWLCSELETLQEQFPMGLNISSSPLESTSADVQKGVGGRERTGDGSQTFSALRPHAHFHVWKGLWEKAGRTLIASRLFCPSPLRLTGRFDCQYPQRCRAQRQLIVVLIYIPPDLTWHNAV